MVDFHPARLRCAVVSLEKMCCRSMPKKNLAGISGAVSGSSGVDPDRGSGNFCSFLAVGRVRLLFLR